MIDMIVNDRAGIVVVHDERDLDLTRSIEISRRTGEVGLRAADGRRRSIGSLKPSMLSMIEHEATRPADRTQADRTALMVRMSNWSIAKTASVDLDIIG